jgi:hypothetical protein
LRDVQAIRGPAEMKLLGDRDEVTEVAEFHDPFLT